MINLQQHVLSIFLMGEVAPTPRLAPTSMGSMHSLPGPFFVQDYKSDLDTETP